MTVDAERVAIERELDVMLRPGRRVPTVLWTPREVAGGRCRSCWWGMAAEVTSGRGGWWRWRRGWHASTGSRRWRSTVR